MLKASTEESGEGSDRHEELNSMEIQSSSNGHVGSQGDDGDDVYNNGIDNEEFDDEPDVGSPADYASLNTQSTIDDDDGDDDRGPGAGPSSSRIPIDDAIELLGMGHFQHLIFLAAGLCFAADSMEVLLLSFLSVVLRAQWGWSSAEAASVTSAVFIGQSFGTLILGYAGDRVGRKPAFMVTASIICFFGFTTSFCNSLVALVMCRFMVGFGVGGLTVPFDTFAEFIPNSHRGSHLVTIEYWWCAGTLLTCLLAMATLGQSGDGSHDNSWRWFVAWCSVPCFISSVASYFYVPESPRWLVSQGRQGDALKVLKHAAIVNGKDPNQLFPPGTELYQLDVEHAENFFDLFKPQWIRTTCLLTVTWAGYTLIAYSNLFLVTYIFSNEKETPDEEGSYSFDYQAILASTPSEIVGTTLVLLTIDRVGRIPSQFVTYAIGGVAVFAMCFFAREEQEGHSSRLALIALGFVGRMCFFAGSCVTWVTTTEVLPTEIRNVGHSAANAVGRVSASLSPFLASIDRPYLTTGTIIMVISFVTALASSGLTETKGAAMGLVPEGQAGGGTRRRSGYDVV